MKQIIYLLSVLAVMTLAACSGSTFKMSADIKGMGNQNVHIVFLGDSGVSDTFLPVNDGKFNVQGTSTELTVVSILDSQNKPLFRVAVKGGETVNVAGDINNPHHYQCSGSDVAKEWMEFESANAALYDQPDGKALDAAIEKYVTEHKDNVVSALLLVFDYSDVTSDKAQKLLAGLDPKARPESIVNCMQRTQDATGSPITQLHTMMLCGFDGEFEAMNPTEAKAMLIYWWTDNNQERRDHITAIKKLSEQYADGLMVADVSLNADTSAWRAVVKADTTQWKHYWAPGSILDPAVEPLKLKRLPLCILADSTGNQLYRGKDIAALQKTLEKYFNK